MHRLPISLMRDMLGHVRRDARSLDPQEVVNAFCQMTSDFTVGLDETARSPEVEIPPIADGRVLRYDALTGHPLLGDSGESVDKLPLSIATIAALRKQLGIDAVTDEFVKLMRPLFNDWERWVNESRAEFKRIHSELRKLDVPARPLEEQIEYLERAIREDAEEGVVHEPSIKELAALYARRDGETPTKTELGPVAYSMYQALDRWYAFSHVGVDGDKVVFSHEGREDQPRRYRATIEEVTQ